MIVIGNFMSDHKETVYKQKIQKLKMELAREKNENTILGAKLAKAIYYKDRLFTALEDMCNRKQERDEEECGVSWRGKGGTSPDEDKLMQEVKDYYSEPWKP